MARPRRSLHRIRFLVLLVSTGMQLPALVWLSLQAARLSSALAVTPFLVAALITTPFLYLQLHKPFSDEPKPAWLRYLALWPFFTWWATSSMFAVLGSVVYTVTRLAHQGTTTPLGYTLVLSALAGLWSVTRTPRLVELELTLPDLPLAFDGYRVAQLSDVHLGSYTPKSRVDDWVSRLNAARVDLIAITGDLVTSGDAFIDDVAASLGNLDAPDGVFACMGNHDYFCDAERLVAGLRESGIQVLRNEGVHLERDGQRIYVAGLEDSWTRRNDLGKTLRDRKPAEATLLLAHDPNHFPEAVAAGVSLQLSGHTHGGQLALPFAKGRYNFARLITRYTHGVFTEGRSSLYVSRGAGTTGPPVRLFAPAELTVLTLRAPPDAP
ncbi:MAG: metallophosphoesterase [Polyangia bacterium]